MEPDAICPNPCGPVCRARGQAGPRPSGPSGPDQVLHLLPPKPNICCPQTVTTSGGGFLSREIPRTQSTPRSERARGPPQRVARHFWGWVRFSGNTENTINPQKWCDFTSGGGFISVGKKRDHNQPPEVSRPTTPKGTKYCIWAPCTSSFLDAWACGPGARLALDSTPIPTLGGEGHMLCIFIRIC